MDAKKQPGTEYEEEINQFCRNHPGIIKKMFAQFDLERPELSEAQKALSSDKTAKACRIILDHYRSSPSGEWLRKPLTPVNKKSSNPDLIKSAENILNNDIFVIQCTSGQIPRTAKGGLDWKWLGPNNDPEWAWLLNRLGYMHALLAAYQQTGDAKYIKRIDSDIKDWILNSPYSGKPENPQWRGLEAAFRADVFVKLFYTLQETDEFSDVARLLILSTLSDHANYLKKYHQSGGNWIVTEMRGMAIIGGGWPELKNASEYLNYAIKTSQPQLKAQIFEDGTQCELTAHYHNETLNSFSPIAEFAKNAGCKISPDYDKQIEKMWNYLAMTLRPNGLSLLNSDSDLNSLQNHIKNGIKIYARKDWLYVITNGKEGTRPEGEASVFFPWAGQLISRSGWDEDAQWSFFDIGPYGAGGHRHLDKLHFSADACGRNILVDSGRFAYFGEIADKYRSYAIGTSSHNVVTIAGQNQVVDKSRNEKPQTKDCQITSDYDFAKGSVESGYTNTEGIARNTRLIRYERGKYWIVIDRFETDRPRKIEAYWHYHPDCTVISDGLEVTSNDKNLGNIRIIPFGSINWNMHIVKGQLKPAVQGWYSEEYGKYEANPTAVYNTKIEDTAVFGWLIIPGLGTPEKMQAEIIASDDYSVTVKIVEPDREMKKLEMIY